MEEKKVLIIGIGFYDYEKLIIDQFKMLNYNVDYFCEVPQNTIIYRFYSRVNNLRKLEQFRSTLSYKIANDCGENYDLVFIIKCEYLTIEAIEKIKIKSPSAKFVLYLWDSIARFKEIKKKFKFFDEIYSFDRLDCLSNSLINFNPLFYRSEYVSTIQKSNADYIYDIYHLGLYHSDRLVLIREIAEYCSQNNIKHKMILYTGYFSYLYQKLFGGELKGNKQYLIFKAISANENRENILHSKVTLDIAHELQSGLTMRTIELLGMQRKIITTNSDIVNYNFYHPNNILIIDRKNPVLSKAFFESDFIPISTDIISQYSISNWLNKMLN